MRQFIKVSHEMNGKTIYSYLAVAQIVIVTCYEGVARILATNGETYLLPYSDLAFEQLAAWLIDSSWEEMEYND